MMARGEISYFKIGRKLVRFQVEEALKRMCETVLVRAEGEAGEEAGQGVLTTEARSHRGGVLNYG